MEKVNIILGRFQPFTLGHLKCAQEAHKKLGVKTVLMVIETNKQDDKHPFLTSQISKILDKMCKTEPTLEGYVLVKNADIVKNIEILRMNRFLGPVVLIGLHRTIEWLKTMGKGLVWTPILKLLRSKEVMKISLPQKYAMH